MKNSKLRRALMLVACAVMLVSLSVGATLAYLTAKTNEVTNTFTVGKVAITLDETAVKAYDSTKNEYEKDETKDRVLINDYKLRPGVKIAKDPTIHVIKNSEDCYVRAIVKVTYKTTAETLLAQAVDDGWVQGLNTTAFTWKMSQKTVNEQTGMTTREYEVRHNTKVARSATDQALVLFTGIKLPATLDGDEMALLADFRIDIVANAIQADGFANADAAWAAFQAN